MRARFIVLVLAILLVAGFAAQNWSEFIRPTQLLFGTYLVSAPLGIVLLAMLAFALLAFLLASATMATRSLVESRHHHKTLEAQRELADKAEASRFTELRRHLDLQLMDLKQRDSVIVTEFEKAVLRSQHGLLAELEQMNRALVTRAGELERRLDERPGLAPAMATAPIPAVALPSMADTAARVSTAAEDLRDTVEEAEARQRRQHAERERERDLEAGPGHRAEPGWRRWF